MGVLMGDGQDSPFTENNLKRLHLMLLLWERYAYGGHLDQHSAGPGVWYEPR